MSQFRSDKSVFKFEPSTNKSILVVMLGYSVSELSWSFANSQNFVSIQSELAENSNLKYTIIDFGGKNSITNYYSNLKGNFSENNLNSIYLGKENQLFDLNYIGELRGIESKLARCISMYSELSEAEKKEFLIAVGEQPE